MRETWSEVDVVGFCVPANEKVGKGDRFIAEELGRIAAHTPVVAVVTKTDTARPEQVAERLTEVAALMDFAEVVPTLGAVGLQVSLLSDLLVGLLPEGPQLYPDGDLTDEPTDVLVAELVREAALEACATSCRTRSPSSSRRRSRRRTCWRSTRSSTSSGPARRAS